MQKIDKTIIDSLQIFDLLYCEVLMISLDIEVNLLRLFTFWAFKKVYLYWRWGVENVSMVGQIRQVDDRFHKLYVSLCTLFELSLFFVIFIFIDFFLTHFFVLIDLLIPLSSSAGNCIELVDDYLHVIRLLFRWIAIFQLLNKLIKVFDGSELFFLLLRYLWGLQKQNLL